MHRRGSALLLKTSSQTVLSSLFFFFLLFFSASTFRLTWSLHVRIGVGKVSLEDHIVNISALNAMRICSLSQVLDSAPLKSQSNLS